MENEPNFDKKIDYEKVLTVELRDSEKEELKQVGFFRFVVTPEFNIIISKKLHDDFFNIYGVNLDMTFTEGTIENEKGGDTAVSFKHRIYQPIPGFKGSEEDFEALKKVVKYKIMEFMK